MSNQESDAHEEIGQQSSGSSVVILVLRCSMVCIETCRGDGYERDTTEPDGSFAET